MIMMNGLFKAMKTDFKRNVSLFIYKKGNVPRRGVVSTFSDLEMVDFSITIETLLYEIA